MLLVLHNFVLVHRRIQAGNSRGNIGFHHLSCCVPGRACANQSCARLMSRESNLTRLWLKWVESELSRPWKSGIWVESELNHADRHLSQSWINWILLESKLSHWFFWRENVKILHLSVTLPGKKQPTTTFNRIPPPRSTTFFAKLGKMWWVVSQIWLLSQSWVRLANFGIWVESVLSQSRKIKCWVESELSHLDCHMSQSRVSPKNLSRAQPWYQQCMQSLE